jgi:thiosulfate/3-mercaptopyruvate sulfurtransferase
MPTPRAFAAWLGSVGLTNTMQAVVYDRQGANYCGRLWWMLKWAGHEAVAVLDGGLQAWQAAAGAVERAQVNRPAPANPVRAPRPALRTLATTPGCAGRSWIPHRP